MSYYGIPNAQVQAAMTQYKYINDTSNQYNQYILGGGNYMGSGSAAGNASGIGVGVYTYPTVTTTNYPTHYYGGGLTSHQHNTIPAPTGQMVSITFMDANGLAYSLDIDAAYVQLLQAISLQHQWRAGAQQANAYQQPKMLEGDFSEDEMSQAEQIIQEMGNGSQEPCQCEA